MGLLVRVLYGRCTGPVACPVGCGPPARGAHSGLNGPMVLLESMDRARQVYVEAQDVVTVRSAQNEVSEFWLRYGMLRTQALNTEESSRLIERMAGEL